MRMCFKSFLTLAVIAAGVMVFVPARADNRSHVTAEQRAQYRAIANDVGLTYNVLYRYEDLVAAKRQNNIGAAGQYEFMNCDGEQRGQLGMCIGFAPHETWYYSARDVTITYAYQKIDGQLYARVAKLARGRVPDLIEQ